MILLYRITPFLVALTALLGYSAFIARWAHPYIIVSVSVLCFALLIARLLKFHVSEFSFWFFLGIASLFFLASFGMLFLFEVTWVSIAVAVLSAALLVLYTEFVFLYTHLPARYQPFSLEHLSSLMNLLSIFYISAFAYAVRLFIQAPLLLLSVSFFLLSFFFIYGMLWVTKAEEKRAKNHAFFGAILLTEAFVGISFLPTGFYANASFLTISSYAFFGLTRTEALHKLSPEVVKRYIVVSLALLGSIILSTKWL